MSSGAEVPELTRLDAQFALVVAMTVRNAMEDFHVQHLTDAQMAELNPIIRNAIATALHARTNIFRSRAARDYIAFQEMLIPEYWEPPALLEDYVQSWDHSFSRHPEDLETCQHCGRQIVDTGLEERRRWTHLSADGGMAVGCRAASFVPKEGWDDTLDRRWRARPTRRDGTAGNRS